MSKEYTPAIEGVKKTAMKVILVRHGETDWNKQRRIQGRTDVELNETGRKQGEALARALQLESVDAIYTSPLKRARETANLIARFHKAEVVALDGLREIDAGKIDGLTYEEIKSQYGDFLNKWLKDCTAVGPPGGSTLRELQDQVWSTFQEIMERRRQSKEDHHQQQEGVVVVVAHSFPIRLIICKALELELSKFWRLGLDLASICTLDFNPSNVVLLKLNDTCHLKDNLP